MCSSKLVICCLAGFLVLGSASDSWARYNTGAYRRYIQAQQKQYQMMMQMEQKAMMQAIAQQQAIEKHHREMQSKASQAEHDKELKRRQNIIARQKTAQDQPATRTTSTKTDSAKTDKDSTDKK